MKKIIGLFKGNEKGALNTTGLLMMGIAMIFIAVGFIVYPIVITATDAILAYTFSGLSTITDASYTGLTAVTGIVPLLVLIGFLVAGVVTGFMGLQVTRGMRTGRLNPVSLLMLAIGIIFIAVGLIIFPVVLDGVSTSVANQASQTDVQTGVTTAVGVTSGNVTLTQTLFDGLVSEVSSVASNISESALAADNYSDPTLFLTGLTANATRTITTVYDYADSLASYTGLNAVLLITPLLVLTTFIAASIIVGFFGVKSFSQ